MLELDIIDIQSQEIQRGNLYKSIFNDIDDIADTRICSVLPSGAGWFQVFLEVPHELYCSGG